MDKIEQAIKEHMNVVGNLLEALGDERRFVPAQDAVEQSIRNLAALVAAHEREQCALVCDAMGNPWRGSEDCAAAIRARTELSKVIPD